MEINSKNISSDVSTDVFVDAILLVALVFLIGAVVLTTTLFIITYLHNKREESKQKWAAFFQDLIVGYVTEPESMAILKLKTQKWIQYEWLKNVFVDELLLFNHTFVGVEKGYLRELFYKLGFNKYISQSLSNSKRTDLLRSLQLIQEFKVQIPVDALLKLSNDSHFSVSVMAGQVLLKQEKRPLQLMIENKNSISRGHQIILGNTSKQISHTAYNDIPDLLASKDSSLIQFGVMLVSLIKYKPAYPTIKELALTSIP